jgi:antiviral defense system Shedu protein SduA
MSKDFTEVAFNLVQFKKELDQFRDLLNLKKTIGEREIQELFKASPHLTAHLGMTFGNIGVAKQVAYEFEIMGDYGADIVFGQPAKQFCLVELENADPDSVLEKVGKKSTKEWSRRFEHGFSQIVDWFCHLDDFKKTDRFHKNFGYGHIDFVALLLIGRNEGLDADDIRRLRWRTHHVIVNSHPIVSMTYDDLYKELSEGYERYSAAFRTEISSTPDAAGR